MRSVSKQTLYNIWLLKTIATNIRIGRLWDTAQKLTHTRNQTHVTQITSRTLQTHIGYCVSGLLCAWYSI